MHTSLCSQAPWNSTVIYRLRVRSQNSGSYFHSGSARHKLWCSRGCARTSTFCLGLLLPSLSCSETTENILPWTLRDLCHPSQNPLISLKQCAVNFPKFLDCFRTKLAFFSALALIWNWFTLHRLIWRKLGPPLWEPLRGGSRGSCTALMNGVTGSRRSEFSQEQVIMKWDLTLLLVPSISGQFSFPFSTMLGWVSLSLAGCSEVLPTSLFWPGLILVDLSHLSWSQCLPKLQAADHSWLLPALSWALLL
jgi:hypothetical protein